MYELCKFGAKREPGHSLDLTQVTNWIPVRAARIADEWADKRSRSTGRPGRAMGYDPRLHFPKLMRMSDPADDLVFPYEGPPASGAIQEVAPGVYWLQMPLPMSLNHINLYLLEDDDGYVIVDTGIRGEETRKLWQQIIDALDKPISRVICTHMHPDHTGQAGFLTNTCRVPLSMSYAEFYQARAMSAMMMGSGSSWQMSEYFERAGIDPDFMTKMREMRGSWTPQPEDHPFPASFERLVDGQLLTIGGQTWEVLTGSGHSPEHVCLYSKSLRVLLSGDQILPIITSNVSVSPSEPFGNPMPGWLASLARFRERIPDETLILPAHNLPFYGAKARLTQLIDHHEDRMLILEESCLEPRTAVELLPHLFKRELTGPSMFMGLGECIAHLHCLMHRSRLSRSLDEGIYRYRSIDPTLATRGRPGVHDDLDEPQRPNYV